MNCQYMINNFKPTSHYKLNNLDYIKYKYCCIINYLNLIHQKILNCNLRHSYCYIKIKLDQLNSNCKMYNSYLFHHYKYNNQHHITSIYQYMLLFHQFNNILMGINLHIIKSTNPNRKILNMMYIIVNFCMNNKLNYKFSKYCLSKN